MDKKTGNKAYYLINDSLLAYDTKMLNYSSDGDVVGVAFDATNEKNPYVAYRTNERGRVVVKKAFPSFESARQNAAIMYDDLCFVMEKVERSIAQKKHKSHFFCTGRRKQSAARVRIVPFGHGKITINNKDNSDNYGNEALISIIRNSLKRANILNKVDVIVDINGGDLDGQAEAISQGISRELYYYNNRALCERRKREEERKKRLRKAVAAKRASQFSKR